MKLIPKINLKKYLKEIGFIPSVILFFAAIIAAFIYSWLFGVNLAVGLLAMLLAVFGSYYLFLSFERVEKPLELEPSEERNLRTLEVGVVIFPKSVGGVRSRDMFRNLSIYLTNRRIIARNAWNEYFLDLPLTSIQGFKREKIIATEYIRLRFLEKGKQTDALVFVGDREGTRLWIDRLRKLGVKEISEKEKEEGKEEKGRDIDFIENAKEIKKQI